MAFNENIYRKEILEIAVSGMDYVNYKSHPCGYD